MDRFSTALSTTRFPQFSAGSQLISALLSTALLASCTGTTPPPAVEVRTVVQTVEVAKPCPVTKPARPATLARPLPTDAVALAAIALAKLAE